MRDVKRRSALIVDWSNFVRTGGRRLGGAKEEEEGEGADQDNLITDYTRAVKRTSRNITLLGEGPFHN